MKFGFNKKSINIIMAVSINVFTLSSLFAMPPKISGEDSEILSANINNTLLSTDATPTLQDRHPGDKPVTSAVLSPDQCQALEWIYPGLKHPSLEEIAKLAEEMSVSSNSIFRWFSLKNRPLTVPFPSMNASSGPSPSAASSSSTSYTKPVGAGSSSSSDIGKRKRGRHERYSLLTGINKTQKDALQASYESNPIPSMEERSALAERIGLAANRVSSWFSKKRHQDRQKQIQSVSPGSQNLPLSTLQGSESSKDDIPLSNQSSKKQRVESIPPLPMLIPPMPMPMPILLPVASAALSQPASATVSHDEFLQFIREGNLEKVKNVIEQEHKFLNAVDAKGNSVLHIAAALGHDPLISYLVTSGSLVLQNPQGATPLHFAAAHGRLKADALLLRDLPLQRVQDQDGNTPLHLALAKNHTESAQLLTQEALLQVANRNGDTPVLLALAAENVKVLSDMMIKAHVLWTHPGNIRCKFRKKIYPNGTTLAQLHEEVAKTNPDMADLLRQLPQFSLISKQDAKGLAELKTKGEALIDSKTFKRAISHCSLSHDQLMHFNNSLVDHGLLEWVNEIHDTVGLESHESSVDYQI